MRRGKSAFVSVKDQQARISRCAGTERGAVLIHAQALQTCASSEIVSSALADWLRTARELAPQPPSLVQQVQFLARLEAHRLAGRDAHFRACPRIAPNPGLARAHVEHAKATQLDALAFRQGALQGFKHRIDSGFGLVALQPCPLNDLVDNILLNQCLPPIDGLPESMASVEMFESIVNEPGVP